MDLRILIVVVLVAVVGQRLHRRRLEANLDPAWRDRWRQLPLRDRWRIARAAQRNAGFDSDEAALAAGAARLQQQLVRFPMGTWVALALAVAITLAMAIQGDAEAVPVGLAVAGLLAWRLVRLHRTRRNLARTAAVSQDLRREPA